MDRGKVVHGCLSNPSLAFGLLLEFIQELGEEITHTVCGLGFEQQHAFGGGEDAESIGARCSSLSPCENRSPVPSSTQRYGSLFHY